MIIFNSFSSFSFFSFRTVKYSLIVRRSSSVRLTYENVVTKFTQNIEITSVKSDFIKLDHLLVIYDDFVLSEKEISYCKAILFVYLKPLIKFEGGFKFNYYQKKLYLRGVKWKSDSKYLTRNFSFREHFLFDQRQPFSKLYKDSIQRSAFLENIPEWFSTINWPPVNQVYYLSLQLKSISEKLDKQSEEIVNLHKKFEDFLKSEKKKK